MAAMERIHLPDGLVSDELRVIMDDQLDMIEQAINAVSGVVRRRTIPENPREGQIYYLEEDLDAQFAAEGFWVFLNLEWYRMDLTKATDLPGVSASTGVL